MTRPGAPANPGDSDGEAESTAARFDELEARLAHQDHSLLELSNEVYSQQRQIAALELLVRQLRERIEPLEQAQPAGDPASEVPPHY
jgi:uncharacterized coiled-coil protein SlyX